MNKSTANIAAVPQLDATCYHSAYNKCHHQGQLASCCSTPTMWSVSCWGCGTDNQGPHSQDMHLSIPTLTSDYVGRCRRIHCSCRWMEPDAVTPLCLRLSVHMLDETHAGPMMYLLNLDSNNLAVGQCMFVDVWTVSRTSGSNCMLTWRPPPGPSQVA